MRISGCAAIVTGGCQGIGKGILYALLRKNAKVSSNIDQGTFHVYSTPKLRQGRTCPRRTSLNYANKLSNMPPAKGSSVKH